MLVPESTSARSAAVEIEAGDPIGPLELWRQSIGIGGVNAQPLSPRVVSGLRALKPRLIRVFIQEYFNVYPEHGRFDWSLLDPYMDSLAQTGAKVVASVCIKPRALYPAVDEKTWQPADVAEWQRLIERMARRYSVDRDLVRYWEIGNETDIGERGGCPYLIPSPNEYKEFYDMTASAIRRVAGHVKVGGPAACWVTNEPLPGFVELCRAEGTQLDFVSWHLYSDDWERHRKGVETAQTLVAGWGGKPLELMVTEWNRAFPAWAVEDEAYTSRGCALVTAAVIAMDSASLGWSFYYHVMDQVCEPEVFAGFMSGPGVDNMYRHWNETPHRFGLFGEQGEARPQYFLFKLLSGMGELRLRHHTEADGIHVLAGLGERGVSTMIVNLSREPTGAAPRVATLHLKGLSPGQRVLTLYRIDGERRWSDSALELWPVERRRVEVRETFEFQVLLPEDSVVVAKLGAPDRGRAYVGDSVESQRR